LRGKGSDPLRLRYLPLAAAVAEIPSLPLYPRYGMLGTVHVREAAK
jgi:hypothetical protein